MKSDFSKDGMEGLFDFWCQFLLGVDLSIDDVDEFTMIASDYDENLLYITDALSGEIIDTHTIH